MSVKRPAQSPLFITSSVQSRFARPLARGLLIAVSAVALSACQTFGDGGSDSMKSSSYSQGSTALPAAMADAADRAWESENFGQSLNYYSLLFQRAPDNRLVRARYAESLRRMGKPQRAIEVLEPVVLGDSPAVAELMTYAKANLQLRQVDDALNASLQATDLEPNNGAALQVLGLSLAASDQHEAAIAAFETALKAGTPDTALTLNNLGLSYVRAGEVAKSVEVLGQAASMDPANQSIARNLAMVEKIHRAREAAGDPGLMTARSTAEDAMAASPNGYQAAMMVDVPAAGEPAAEDIGKPVEMTTLSEPEAASDKANSALMAGGASGMKPDDSRARIAAPKLLTEAVEQEPTATLQPVSMAGTGVSKAAEVPITPSTRTPWDIQANQVQGGSADDLMEAEADMSQGFAPDMAPSRITGMDEDAQTRPSNMARNVIQPRRPEEQDLSRIDTPVTTDSFQPAIPNATSGAEYLAAEMAEMAEENAPAPSTPTPADVRMNVGYKPSTASGAQGEIYTDAAESDARPRFSLGGTELDQRGGRAPVAPSEPRARLNDVADELIEDDFEDAGITTASALAPDLTQWKPGSGFKGGSSRSSASAPLPNGAAKVRYGRHERYDRIVIDMPAGQKAALTETASGFMVDLPAGSQGNISSLKGQLKRSVANASLQGGGSILSVSQSDGVTRKVWQTGDKMVIDLYPAE